MKTNRMLDQQILQDTMLKNMTLTSAMVPQMMSNMQQVVSGQTSAPNNAQHVSAAPHSAYRT
jgi:hypothetical protein